MKNAITVLSLLLLFAIPSSLAQGNKKRGLIVLNNKDSLYGWINYPTNQKSQEKIIFYRDSIASNPEKYSITDLCYFEITGDNAYVRALVPNTVPMYTVSSNAIGSEDTTISKTVWLRIVLTGHRLSLFEWKNERVHYYIKESTGDYIEMQLKKTNDQGYERELHLYKNQLTAFAIKYELANQTLSRAIDNAGYNEDDLSRIITELNGNQNIVQYKRKRERFKLTAFINGGVNWARLKLSGDKTYVGNLTFNPSVAPFFSVGVELSNIGINRFALRLESSYTSVSYEGKGPSYTSTNNQMAYELEQRTITPAFSVLYSLLQKRYFSLYGCVGLAYNLSSYKKNVWSQTFPALTLTDYADLKKRYVAVSIKLGIRVLQKFEIGVGRQFYDDYIFQSSKYKFEHPAYHVWAGYRFK